MAQSLLVLSELECDAKGLLDDLADREIAL
jgi:hypothetical protein